jgi:hypothetical protein
MPPPTVRVLSSIVQVPPALSGCCRRSSRYRRPCQGAVVDHKGAAFDRQAGHQSVVADCPSATTNCQGVAADHQDVVIDLQGVVDLVALKPKRLSLRDVLIVEAIDLDEWIFTP